MLMTKWNAEGAQYVAREEGIQIGEARGEARGEAKVTQIIRLFLQNKPLDEISATLDMPAEKVMDILQKTGLLKPAQ